MMNREAVRIFAAETRGFTLQERFEVAQIVVEQTQGGPFNDAEQALSDAVVRLVNGPWFHGGLPGRVPGDLLLPASETGMDPRNCGDEIMSRGRFVYVTPSRDVARVYAEHARGLVYQVRPIGPLLVDPVDLRSFLLVAMATGTIGDLRRMGWEAVAAKAAPSFNAFACGSAVVE